MTNCSVIYSCSTKQLIIIFLFLKINMNHQFSLSVSFQENDFFSLRRWSYASKIIWRASLNCCEFLKTKRWKYYQRTICQNKNKRQLSWGDEVSWIISIQLNILQTSRKVHSLMSLPESSVCCSSWLLFS